jgi:hypothetical protein
VEDALSEEIIAGTVALGDSLELYVKEQRIAFRKRQSAAPVLTETTI